MKPELKIGGVYDYSIYRKRTGDYDHYEITILKLDNTGAKEAFENYNKYLNSEALMKFDNSAKYFKIKTSPEFFRGWSNIMKEALMYLSSNSPMYKELIKKEPKLIIE